MSEVLLPAVGALQEAVLYQMGNILHRIKLDYRAGNILVSWRAVFDL